METTQHFIAFTDGGARGTPGPSSCAAYFPNTKTVTGKYLGTQTNNFAEYSGLLLALEAARGHNKVHIFMDSELVVKQIKGIYRVKSETLLPLYLEAMDVISAFDEFEITHVKREFNSEADAECNRILDEQELKEECQSIQ